MAVLRTLIGEALRTTRLRQDRTLREVSAAARVSLGYLSEVERGQKEASSELLASICRALGVRLSDVLREVSESLSALEPEPVPVGDRVGAGDTAVRTRAVSTTVVGTRVADSRVADSRVAGRRVGAGSPVQVAPEPAAAPAGVAALEPVRSVRDVVAAA